MTQDVFKSAEHEYIMAPMVSELPGVQFFIQSSAVDDYSLIFNFAKLFCAV